MLAPRKPPLIDRPLPVQSASTLVYSECILFPSPSGASQNLEGEWEHVPVVE
jgi:hypothetical protein